MKRLVFIMMVLASFGCGDERGANDDKKDPFVRIDLEFDPDQLDEDCYYYSEHWNTKTLIEDDIDAGEGFVSDPFAVSVDDLIQEIRDIGEQDGVVMLISYAYATIHISGLPKGFDKEVRVELLEDDEVVDFLSAKHDDFGLDCLGQGCSYYLWKPDYLYESVIKNDGASYSIRVASEYDAKIVLNVGLGHYGVKPECL